MNITNHSETTRRSHEQLAHLRKAPITMAKKTKTKKSALDHITKREKISVQGHILQATITAETIAKNLAEATKGLADLQSAQAKLSSQLSDLLGFFSTGRRLGIYADATKPAKCCSDLYTSIYRSHGHNDPSHAGTGGPFIPRAKDLARGKLGGPPMDRSQSEDGVPLRTKLSPRHSELIPPISQLRDNLFERCTADYCMDASYFEFIAEYNGMDEKKLADLICGIEFKWEKRAFPPHRQDGQWKHVYEFRPKK